MSPLDDLISEIGDLLTTAVPLTPEQQAELQRYGGRQLQWDDNHTTNPPVCEGAGRTAPDPLPAPGADDYVTILQKDLQALGIFDASQGSACPAGSTPQAIAARKWDLDKRARPSPGSPGWQWCILCGMLVPAGGGTGICPGGIRNQQWRLTR